MRTFETDSPDEIRLAQEMSALAERKPKTPWEEYAGSKDGLAEYAMYESYESMRKRLTAYEEATAELLAATEETCRVDAMRKLLALQAERKL